MVHVEIGRPHEIDVPGTRHGHDHAHDHGHDHAHGAVGAHAHVAPGGDARTALWRALLLNGAFFFLEAGAGWWTGSVALASDAAHMASDVAALVLALGAVELSAWPASRGRTYGWRRAEVLGAFVNGLAVLPVSIWIAVEALERLWAGPPEVPGLPVLIVGAVGLAVNLGSAWSLWRASTGLNVRAALAHMLADALGSVAAVVAAGLLLAGVPAADAAVGVGVAILVFWLSARVVRDAGRILLEAAPDHVDVGAVADALAGVPGVDAVHDLHVWSVDGTEVLLTAHLVAEREVTTEARRVLREQFRILHATLQVERPDGGPCGSC